MRAKLQGHVGASETTVATIDDRQWTVAGALWARPSSIINQALADLAPVVLGLVVLSLLLAGCAQGEMVIGPPDIQYGEDQCHECGMIISDPRFASGFLHEVSQGRYESITFDDIGDMLAYIQKNPDQSIIAWYVHDYASEEWLDATQAYYVSSSELHTPMGHGLAAHATRSAAQSMAAENHGQVLDWPSLQTADDHAGHVQ